MLFRYFDTSRYCFVILLLWDSIRESTFHVIFVVYYLWLFIDDFNEIQDLQTSRTIEIFKSRLIPNLAQTVIFQRIYKFLTTGALWMLIFSNLLNISDIYSQVYRGVSYKFVLESHLLQHFYLTRYNSYIHIHIHVYKTYLRIIRTQVS